MISRILMITVAFCAAPAFAQDISGSWKFHTGDTKPNLGCTVSGALTLRNAPELAQPMHCEMTVAYQCKKQPGYHIITKQPCKVTRRQGVITIEGVSYEIIEENRAPSWGDKYYPENFTLSLMRDGKSMTGRFGSRTRATFERVKDFAE